MGLIAAPTEFDATPRDVFRSAQHDRPVESRFSESA